MNAKLFADIKADVLKYENEANVLDTAYKASKIYTDFLADPSYFNTDIINTVQDLADIETEVIKTRNNFDMISKNIQNIIPSNFNPTGAPRVATIPPPRVATTWAQYSALYFATYKVKPPAGRWNTYQTNGILIK
jgi:hypothetical protein